MLWCAPGRGAPGRPGAVRSQFSPQPGRWGGAKPFCAPGWGVGAGRSHFAPRLGRWGGARPFCAPSWGVGAGRLCILGPLVRPTPRGACSAPVIINMKFENIFLLIFLYKKKEVKNWNFENIFYASPRHILTLVHSCNFTLYSYEWK